MKFVAFYSSRFISNRSLRTGLKYVGAIIRLFILARFDLKSTSYMFTVLAQFIQLAFVIDNVKFSELVQLKSAIITQYSFKKGFKSDES